MDTDVIEPRADLSQRFALPTHGRFSMPQHALRLLAAFFLTATALMLVSRSLAEEPRAKAPSVEIAPPEKFNAEQKGHWAYQPLVRPDLPEVKESRWVRNAIDRFILAELEGAELPHAPEADRVSLIRRVT